jgi:UPF0755 protein
MSVLSPYDVEQDPPPYREGQRWPWILLGVFVIFLLAVAASIIWVRNQIDPPGAPGDAVHIRVEEGMSVDAIGELLEREGVIENATVFRYYSRLNGADSVQAGDYSIRKGESMGKVLDVLGGGAEFETIPLTIPEGLTLRQIADKVAELPGRSAERFMEVINSGEVRSQYQPPGSRNLEGLLLPETYFLDKDADETAIARTMVESFDKTATSLGITTAAARFNRTPYEMVVIASLVEREARVPQDRGKISRVIHNRLEQGIKLDIDATVQYALGQQKDVLLFSDLEINSPYNTYKVPGLPPGPIASPGKPALEAAFAPTPGPWIFFVVIEEDGTHAFATTLAEHNRNVAEADRKGVLG